MQKVRKSFGEKKNNFSKIKNNDSSFDIPIRKSKGIRRPRVLETEARCVQHQEVRKIFSEVVMV